MALRIGQANSLGVAVHGESMIDDTSSNEWMLVWGTIQMMASG
jgi:hypothetical protein